MRQILFLLSTMPLTRRRATRLALTSSRPFKRSRVGSKKEPQLLPYDRKDDRKVVLPQGAVHLGAHNTKNETSELLSVSHVEIKSELAKNNIAVNAHKKEEELIASNDDHNIRNTGQEKLETTELSDIEELYVPPNPAKARRVNQILKDYYQYTSSSRSKPIIDSLIATILSQATSRNNSTRAFANLKSRFSSWSEALSAGTAQIQEAIHCAGLSKQKSVTIHALLTRVNAERGECEMEYIRDMSNEDAKNELTSFKGVGPKTAACVLMFAMQRDEFPVDTHVNRISGRLGWMAPGSTPEQTYNVLNGCLPNEIKYSLHVLLIRHGRNICKARQANCAKCPLQDLCPGIGVEEARHIPHASTEGVKKE